MVSESFEVRNPSCPSEILGEFDPTPVNRVAEMAARARSAQKSWEQQTGAAKAAVLNRWANVIDQQAESLAILMSKEVGKPIGEAKGEVGRCSAILRYFAGDAVRENGESIPSLAAGALQVVLHRPVGVVGLITPWNFPMAIPLWKAAPALAFGNAVIVKSSENSSLCLKALEKTALEAGVPEGLFQAIYGAGEQGQALIAAGIDAMSFTGSGSTGKKVIEAAAAQQIRVQAEMGGKNPSIVLKDADLDLAASLIAGAAMRFAGQKCTATSRVIVEEAVADAFMEKFIGAIERLPVGPAENPETAVGPVITKASQQRILQALEGAGKPAYQGSVPSEGWFVPPTVYDHVDPRSDLGQKELFGPVVSVIRVKSPQEAVEVANGVPYGLSASLFTTSLPEAMKYVSQIHAGMIRVNADSTGVDPHAPFGGVKNSSYGSREQGPAAKHFFTETVTVQINP